MDATVIGAVITTAGLIFVDIFQNIRASKKAAKAEQVEELKRQVSDLSETVSRQSSAISNDIGRGNKAALTEQHSEMRELILTETKVVEKRYDDDERRYRQFTAEQHDTAQEIERFKLFMEDWKRLVTICSDQQRQIVQLQTENNELKAIIGRSSGQGQTEHHTRGR